MPEEPDYQYVCNDADGSETKVVPAAYADSLRSLAVADRARVKEILIYYPDRDGYSIIWPRGITALHVGDVREA